MAEIPVQLRGTMYDLASKSARQVFFDGVAWRSDVGVGGGPLPGGPGSPPGIWGGPIDPYPDHGLPGRPPGTWGGAGEPFPTPPIVIPKPPVDPPEGPVDDDGFIKPPSPGSWGFHKTYGWLYDPVAGPK